MNINNDYNNNQLLLLYDGFSGNQIEGDIYQGLAFFHLAPACTVFDKEQTIPSCSTISLGLSNLPQQGCLDDKIMLPINNVTGNISHHQKQTTSVIEISKSFLETHALLTSLNVHARFITEDSYLKNLVSSTSINNLPSEEICKNLENMVTNRNNNNNNNNNNNLSNTLSKASQKKTKFEKIVFHPDSKLHDINTDTENTFDMEAIYQPETDPKHDIEIVDVDEALNFEPDDLKNVIIRQEQEQEQEQIELQNNNEEQNQNIKKQKPETSILDIAEKDTDNSDEKDATGDENKTIILS
jgi:hypothetical protein